jgi:hypothetical protein
MSRNDICDRGLEENVNEQEFPIQCRLHISFIGTTIQSLIPHAFIKTELIISISLKFSEVISFWFSYTINIDVGFLVVCEIFH